MSHIVNIEGQRFGRLVAIKRVGSRKYPGGGSLSFWECKCDCGNITYLPLSALKSHNTESCGCLQKEITRNRYLSHGESHSRINELWKGMKARCNNPKHKSYRWYGAKGVKVCKEWEESYVLFKEWVLANGYDETAPRGKFTIDRIDSYGDYEPSNCRLISIQEQQKNKKAVAK